MMYPHHAQAVEMAELLPTRSQSQQVRDLAANQPSHRGYRHGRNRTGDRDEP
ncbi:DUF305 domain-containing protein [Nocardia sp. NPDC049526]|uniref:DUF305 domain-containing protein n=1 Tax=Nocardia sp. NPDC049526 TaxID=3364316 RepID=UPI0037A14CDB